MFIVEEQKMTEYLNAAKESLLNCLESEGLLKETADNISSRYVIMLKPKGLFGKVWDLFRPEVEEGFVPIVVLKETMKVLKP